MGIARKSNLSTQAPVVTGSNGFSALPPISPALGNLLLLSPSEQLNAKLLGLIASKDPAAVARLLLLANSVAFSAARKKRVSSIDDAIQTLGCSLSIAALFSIWLTEPGSSLKSEDAHIRAFVRSHIFSCYSTLSRLLSYGVIQVAAPVDEIRLYALLVKLPLAYILAEAPGHPAYLALAACANAADHRLYARSEFVPYFVKAVSLAETWEADPRMLEWLADYPQHGAIDSSGQARPVSLAMCQTEELVCAVAQNRNPADSLFEGCIPENKGERRPNLASFVLSLTGI